MPRVTSDEIITQKHMRFFLQPGGSGPSNGLLYSGQDGQYLNIESFSNPVSGGINPINVHDPNQIGRYRAVGRSIDAPDFPTFTAQFLQKKDHLPRHLTTMRDCLTTFYAVVGDCKDLSDFLAGWTAYVKIASQAEVTSPEEAGAAFDSDEQLMDELEFTAGHIYNVGALGIGEKGATEVYSEIVDIVYGSRVQCGGCGPSDDGTKLAYALAKNTVASPGQAPSVIYTTDGGTTWTDVTPTGAASTDVPVAIEVVGQNLVVFFDDGSTGGYFYVGLNSITGAPGATWSKVTTGFTASKAPIDAWASNAREVWVSGEGGYIYKITSLSSGATVKDEGDATTENLNRIMAQDELVVAVGESGKVVYSTNRGETFTITDADPSANGNDALSIVTDYLWWVGDDNGDVYYTEDQGATWTSLGSVPSTAATIQDIVFATDEVGYILYATSDPTAGLMATFNGGADWTEDDPRILNLPTADRFNRAAVPFVPNYNIAANNLLLGGLAGNGSDGIILLAEAAVL